MGKLTKQSFFKGRSPNGHKKKTHVEMLNIHMKELEIKTMLQFHPIPIRMATIKNTKTTQMLARKWRKRKPYTPLVGL
jgi:hypothetical protein